MSRGVALAPDCSVWQFDLDDVAWDRAAACLSADEIEAYLRLRPTQHQQRSRRARIALRLLLAHAWACEPSGLHLQRGPWGKPWVAQAPQQFNLSHSGNWAWLAMAPNPLGVDGESATQLGEDLAGLMQIVCHSEELEQAPADAALRRAWFLRLWTQKEAYCKALGLGFQIDPKRLCVHRLAGEDSIRDERLTHTPPHRLLALRAPQGHALSLCVLGDVAAVSVQELKAGQVLLSAWH